MLVSIVVAAYNAARTIDAALASVLAQTHGAFEVVVVDDGSTDDTAGVVSAVAARDPRVRLVQQPNLGLAAARNCGVRSTTGDWITTIDADDLWRVDKLARQIEAVDGPDCVVLTGLRRFREVDGGIRWMAATLPPQWGHREYLARLLMLPVEQMAIFTTALIPRRVLLEAGGWNERLKTAEDWECWLRCARRSRFVAVNDELYFYRKHAHSLTVSQTVDWSLAQWLGVLRDQRRLGGCSAPALRKAAVVRYLEAVGIYLYGREYQRAAEMVMRSLCYPEAWFNPHTYRRGLEVVRGLCSRA